MKKIVFPLALACLFAFSYPVNAQNVVTGRYKGHLVKMRYYKGEPDDIEFLEYGLVAELNEKITGLKKEVAVLQRELEAAGKEVSKVEDSTQLQTLTLEWNLLEKEQQIDSLQGCIRSLNDSLLRYMQADITRRNSEAERAAIQETGQHICLHYRIGSPWMFGPLFAQTDASGSRVWNRMPSLSHQVGFSWSSASLAKNASITLGVGLEYSRLHLSAGIGHLSETVSGVTDANNHSYDALLTFDNVREAANLHYLSVPLTLSFGQPRTNRISGYGQITLVPTVLAAAKYHVSGTYNWAGHYTELDGVPTDFWITEDSQLGFGSDLSLDSWEKTASPNRFVLLGRVSAGFYLPLCNTKYGENSPWAMKFGVNIDIAATAISHETQSDVFPTSTYHLDQYNILSASASRFVNPGLEVGILYIINKKTDNNGK